MRDEDSGYGQVAQQFGKFAAHMLARGQVQGRHGFVEKQQAWLSNQCARQRHSLLLAAGKLLWFSISKPVELHQLKNLMELARAQFARYFF